MYYIYFFQFHWGYKIDKFHYRTNYKKIFKEYDNMKSINKPKMYFVGCVN